MSFVIPKSPRLDPFVATCIPGPGDYELPRSINTHQQVAAPFNSSSFKRSVFEVDSLACGPASYNPNIQPPRHITSSFVSRVERFPTTYSEEPVRPQSKRETDSPRYREAMAKTKEKFRRLREQNNKRRVESIKAEKECVRIVLSNPKNTEMLQSIYLDRETKMKECGPGSYNVSYNKHGKGPDWSKSGLKRFNSEKSNEQPGPGAYDPEVHIAKKEHELSSFSYAGVRSYLDEIIYKTKIPMKIAFIEQKHLKDRYPGPGQYDTDCLQSKSFHSGPQNFGSHLLKPSKADQELPGPTSYHIQNQKMKRIMNSSVKEARNKIFGKKEKPKVTNTLQQTNKAEIIKACAEKQKEKKNFYSLRERCSSKVGTMGKSLRFNPKVATLPGPGQYKCSQSLQERPFRAVFASVTARISAPQPPQDTPFYEITKHDIGRKAMKTRIDIDNLRQIDLIKAPFNCKEKRFQNSNQIKNDLHEPLIKAQAAQIRKNMRNTKESSAAFKSSTRRQLPLPKNSIGPGAYHPEDKSLQKKSFNLQYNYKAHAPVRTAHSSMRLHSL